MFMDLLKLMRRGAPKGQKITKEDALNIAKAEVESFCQKWATESKFVEYFKKEWLPKIRELLLSWHFYTGEFLACWTHVQKSLAFVSCRYGDAAVQRYCGLPHQHH